MAGFPGNRIKIKNRADIAQWHRTADVTTSASSFQNLKAVKKKVPTPFSSASDGSRVPHHMADIQNGFKKFMRRNQQMASPPTLRKGSLSLFTFLIHWLLFSLMKINMHVHRVETISSDFISYILVLVHARIKTDPYNENCSLTFTDHFSQMPIL